MKGFGYSMVDLINLFALKLVDTAIQSLKSILMIKGKSFSSAVTAAVSYWFFIILMKKLTTTNSKAEIAVALMAVFLGQLITQVASDRYEGDRVWKIIMTPLSLEDGQAIADKLKENNIPVSTDTVRIADLTRVLRVEAFSKSKAHSALINSVISDYDGVELDVTEIKNRL